MKKYLKFKVSDAQQVLIDTSTISRVIGPGTGGADNTNQVAILTTHVGLGVTNASEVLAYKLTFGTMDAAANAVAVNTIIDSIGVALTTSWTNPIYDMTGKTVNACSQIEYDQLVF